MTAPTIPEVDVTGTAAVDDIDDPRQRFVLAHAAMRRIEELEPQWRRIRAIAAREIRDAGTVVREIAELVDVGSTQIYRLFDQADEYTAEEEANPRLSQAAQMLLIAVREKRLTAAQGWREYLPAMDPAKIDRARQRLVDVGYVTETPWPWGEPWPGQPLRLTRLGRARAERIKPEYRPESAKSGLEPGGSCREDDAGKDVGSARAQV